MDRKRCALEPPRESKRSSSFTSSSLRSSLNPDLLFCARARERERERVCVLKKKKTARARMHFDKNFFH